MPNASSVLSGRGVSRVTWISGLVLGTWDLGSLGGGSHWSRGLTALHRGVRGWCRPAPTALRIHQWPRRAQGTRRPVRVRRNAPTRVKRWDRRCGAPPGSAWGVKSPACLSPPTKDDLLGSHREEALTRTWRSPEMWFVNCGLWTASNLWSVGGGVCAAPAAHMMLSFSFQLLNHYYFFKKKTEKTRKKKSCKYMKYFPNLPFTCKRLLYLRKGVI